MEIFMLAGAMVAALGGMMTLAFRVVRLPLGSARKSSARPTTTRAQAAKDGAREPTQILLSHVADEHKRHTMALREALDLRRARNETEALTRLLNERILHTEAARRLGRFAQPSLGGRLRQLIDQARLDWMADTVRREVAEFQFPTNPTRPLAREGALTRAITWMRGGPQAGVAHELALYHREQREHYRLAMVQARRFAREQRQIEALTRLAQEQAYHLRASRLLKRQFQPVSSADLDDATDPALHAILN